MEEPVEYVGGLTEAKRPRTWPYVSVAAALILLALGALIFRDAILATGRNLGDAVTPYSLSLSSSWSSENKIVGVPLTLTMRLQNIDQRSFDGLTLRFTDLSSNLKLTSAKPDGEIDRTAIFFPQRLVPLKTETLTIGFLPMAAGNWQIGISIAPGHGTTPARIDIGDGAATQLYTRVAVRDPRPSDASVMLGTPTWDPVVTAGHPTTWQLVLTNDGPVDIPSVSLAFPEIPPGFELVATSPAASLTPNGRLLFSKAVPRRAQVALTMQLIPHQPGHYLVPIEVYLGDSNDSLTSADGGPPINLDVTVIR